MVLVDSINVIEEGLKKVLYFYTDKGSCSQYIDNRFANVLNAFLGKQDSQCNKMYNSTYTLQKDQIAIVNTNNQSIEKSWEEVLPEALESGNPIYIEESLLAQEFCPNDFQHEALVDELIQEAIIFDKSMKIKDMIQSLVQSIEDERFEDAAILRDKLEVYNCVI